METVHILRDRFPLDGVLEAVTADASGAGLCKLCRVRFLLSFFFGESAAVATLLASLTIVSTADVLALREGTGAAVHSFTHYEVANFTNQLTITFNRLQNFNQSITY